ncbi:MAG: 50S ribosomal protein L20, partial [Eubacteriaceae bacterium]|nr:50S ribosomal protein L20 [Eubacteriaceae bacterium]
MARVKKGLHAKKNHRKVLKLARGYYGGRSKIFRMANEAVIRALRDSFRGRREKKRNYRKL